MTPRRFTVRESREAMLVTADNLDEVAAWCGGKFWRSGDETEERSIVSYGPRLGDAVLAGDVLVTDGTRWWDVGAEEFERESAQWEEQG